MGIGTAQARRVGQAAVALAMAVGVSAAIGALAPGRFADDLRLDPGLAPAAVDALERRSTPSAAGAVANWAAGVVRGDLGRSSATGGPIAPVLFARTASTCVLALPALVFAWAIAWGLTSTGRSRTAGTLPRPAAFTLALLQSVPEALVGLLLVRLALVTAWFPVGGAGEADDTWFETARHAVLPIAGLTVAQLPWLTRQMATVLTEVRGAPFVQAARARGLGEHRIEREHVLPAALPALAPLLGVSLATIPAAAVVMEVVFAWPGLGALIVEAVFARDVPLVLGAVTISAVLVACAGSVADGIRRAADPRVVSW